MDIRLIRRGLGAVVLLGGLISFADVHSLNDLITADGCVLFGAMTLAWS